MLEWPGLEGGRCGGAKGEGEGRLRYPMMSLTRLTRVDSSCKLVFGPQHLER